MKIATWNVERLRHKGELDRIQDCCKETEADILVLTETDTQIKLPYMHCFQTPPIKENNPELYRETENRVSIYTSYRCIREYKTYDKYTALCVELLTEHGSLIVYGTVMGIFGNRDVSYGHDLMKQVEDVKRLSSMGNLCVIGDFNCSFNDNYYFTKKGRELLNQCFSDANVSVLTKDRKECIDHIAISDGFAAGAKISIDEWNYDKALSDHKGIVLEMI